MEELTLTTPALLFSAISLIMLAYTNRFLAYAAVIRNLHDKYLEEMDESLIQQIKSKTATLSNSLDANIWNHKPSVLCFNYVPYIHRPAHSCHLGVWNCTDFIDIIFITFNKRDSHFSRCPKTSFE